MGKIRYKYGEEKDGFQLGKVKCPVCGSKHINWVKVVEHPSWSGKVKLIAECWSGDIHNNKPAHLFIITLTDLPEVEVRKRR